MLRWNLAIFWPVYFLDLNARVSLFQKIPTKDSFNPFNTRSEKDLSLLSGIWLDYENKTNVNKMKKMKMLSDNILRIWRLEGIKREKLEALWKRREFDNNFHLKNFERAHGPDHIISTTYKWRNAYTSPARARDGKT